jgi:hypothetical protein
MSREASSISNDERAIDTLPFRELDLDHVRKAVQGIRYGELRVIIHDGVIVQIERVEKQRLR